MMRNEYSHNAQNTHNDIQNLNDSLQFNIDEFYYHNDCDNNIELNLTNFEYNDNYKNFKIKLLSKLEALNDISIEYFTSSKDTFENYGRKSKFQLSNNLEELLRNYFDVINADINTSDLPKVTNEVIIKYIQINVVYENIMDELTNIDMFDDYCEKRFYTKENIIMLLDFIINGFYDCIDNLKLLCMSEKNILSMVQCYMLNLKIVLCIIEFIESIKYIG